MCGIFFSLGCGEAVYPDDDTANLLRSRGPDSFQPHSLRLKREELWGEKVADAPSSYALTFISTVLSLRGDHVEVQPLIDPGSQSVLCWNGEAWRTFNNPIQGNDAQHIFNLFLDAVRPVVASGNESKTSGYENSSQESLNRMSHIISNISGPFSFVFYDGYRSRIYYGRDYLGRRALLSGWDGMGNFRVCSVCDGTSSEIFEEVGTDGIHIIDIGRASKARSESSVRSSCVFDTVPWNDDCSGLLKSLIPTMNKTLPMGDTAPSLCTGSPSQKILRCMLQRSLELRVRNIPTPPLSTSENSAKVAVLFSGGLDCTILARLAHDLIPINESIDLLNVAFENPRVAAAAAAKKDPKAKTQPSLKDVCEACPDRQTGRSSHAELQRVCPDRTWRFVAINIPYSETLAQRENIKRLMRPHNTEMDLSIACALYFAARGTGEISDPSDPGSSIPYTTSARVLMSGLGADEVFAGYSRHGAAFTRAGFQGLIDEIDLDVGRLGKRNLGRDDRVISHWGKEARYPYLDEEFLGWALQRPVWEKCGFGTEETHQQTNDTAVDGEEVVSLEPEKKALRLLAWELGMKKVACEKKRAIQFGSRTAKMESGKSRGTHVLS